MESTPTAASGPSAHSTADEVRAKAFARLIAFGAKPAFAAPLKGAFDEIWGPGFRDRPESEKVEALARPEAEAGIATYCVLDAPAVFGATIAEQFLAQHGDELSRDELEYLRRLAPTRMGLYRIDEVHRDQGLTCTDLWTNERVEIRERRLTHTVQPHWVIAARAFPAVDGATELDGAVYAFSESEARKVVVMLRAEWTAASKRDADLAQAQFLKRRCPVIINRCWFNNVFFADDSAHAKRYDNEAAALRSRDTRSNLRYFRIADSNIRELAAFMHSAAAPTAMSIDRLHGFLCAVNCGPAIARPRTWLAPIWGTESPRFASQRQCESIVGAIFELSNQIARTISNGTFVPLLPSRPGPGMEKVAQGWCGGFVEGMALKQRSWDRLMNDAAVHMMIVPILVLADPRALVEDQTPNPRATADIVKLLPTAVSMIGDYWNDVARERNTARTQRARAQRAGRSNRIDPAAAPISTVHRLKITLNGIRPAIWRRVEVASDAKLPFVSRVLVRSMGWNDTHLHAYRSGATTYGEPDPDFPSDMRSERSVTLAQIAPKAKDRFFFDYDFGDGWEHTVIVESIEAVADTDSPRCIAGARACPPDDCGGVNGYRDLTDILRNPAHEDYAAVRTWAGDEFEPDRFELQQVNRELQRLARRRRARS